MSSCHITLTKSSNILVAFHNRHVLFAPPIYPHGSPEALLFIQGRKNKKIKNNSNLGKDGLMTKKIPDSTLKLF